MDSISNIIEIQPKCFVNGNLIEMKANFMVTYEKFFFLLAHNRQKMLNIQRYKTRNILLTTIVRISGKYSG